MFEHDTPRVSVVMSVFNGGAHLRAALRSILQQTLPDLELLLIDDGSTDTALEGVSDLLQDPRVRLVRDGLNKGLACRLNEGVEMARGEYVARMDHDDIAYPDRLAVQVAFLERNPQVDLVGCRCLRISGTSEPVGTIPFAETHEALCARRWRGIHIAHPSWLGRRRWFLTHRYAEPGPYLCEDQELLLRAATLSRYAVVPHVLLAYRVRDHVAFSKTFRTRRALGAIQLRHFWTRGEWRNAGLSAGIFVLTSVRDAVHGAIGRAPHDNGFGVEESALRDGFAKVLASVS